MKTQRGKEDHEYFRYLSGCLWFIPPDKKMQMLMHRDHQIIFHFSLNRMRSVVNRGSCLSVFNFRASHHIFGIRHEIICLKKNSKDFVSQPGLNLYRGNPGCSVSKYLSCLCSRFSLKVTAGDESYRLVAMLSVIHQTAYFALFTTMSNCIFLPGSGDFETVGWIFSFRLVQYVTKLAV